MEAERAKALAAKGDDAMTRKIVDLQRIRGIGANFSTVLAREVLYRSFATRRQLVRPCPTRVVEWSRPKH